MSLRSNVLTELSPLEEESGTCLCCRLPLQNLRWGVCYWCNAHAWVAARVQRRTEGTRPLTARLPPCCPRVASPAVVVVGESNPHGADPRLALWDQPDNASGNRLRVVLGLSRDAWRGLARVNLLVGSRWSAPAARESADRVRAAYPGAVVVLLGARVRAAWGVVESRHTRGPVAWVIPHDAAHPDAAGILLLPHPSGRCRTWNTPGTAERVRELARLALPFLPIGEVTE